ncbi:hypothetical protein DXG01_010063 [Tephrocybe rancida]|nr:hypothetical protein DXG01_010063 [Tephrocybe rancida]
MTVHQGGGGLDERLRMGLQAPYRAIPPHQRSHPPALEARAPRAVHTADYATYVKILTWVLDAPNKEVPFSVHCMAFAGKELGTEVGNWFGPITAAGGFGRARAGTLVTAFPDAGLGVAVATDGVLFQSEAFTSSHTVASSARSPRSHTKALSSSWGDRPVLLLIGVHLGLDGVNPIYYETIKARNSPEDPSRSKHLQRDDPENSVDRPPSRATTRLSSSGLLDVLVPRAAVAVAAAAGVFDVEGECYVFRFWGEASYEGAFHHHGLSIEVDASHVELRSRGN